MKKRKIRFDSDAFDKYRSSADQKSIMSYPYTKKIAEMEKDVESLDRFDDFSSLKIHVSNYKKKEGDVYGIERTSFHPTNEVIFKHQKDAATLFLRDLRGFGLLADVVGSGKTYEAGLVLSELSARNKLQSLLLVVPENVIDYWKEVLEIKFGMGKGVIKLAKDFYVDTGSSEKIILDIERLLDSSPHLEKSSNETISGQIGFLMLSSSLFLVTLSISKIIFSEEPVST